MVIKLDLFTSASCALNIHFYNNYSTFVRHKIVTLMCLTNSVNINYGSERVNTD